MRDFFERGALRRAAAPVLVACLLIFQGALAGLASAAAGSASGLIAQICASGDSGSSDDSSKSVLHHAGSCCILQHNVLTQPDVDPESTVVLARVVELVTLSLQYRIDAVIAPPERAPSAPRGPPAETA